MKGRSKNFSPFDMQLFFSSFLNSSSVYVSMGALSAFGSGISKLGMYWHFIKNRIRVFKSLAYVPMVTSLMSGSARREI